MNPALNIPSSCQGAKQVETLPLRLVSHPHRQRFMVLGGFDWVI